MKLAEYLKAVQENPWTFPAVDGCPDPPPEWVAVAWDTEAEESIAQDMARDVSKVGELCCGPEFLAGLSAALSAKQVVRLFRLIRDPSPHREGEFRPQFEAGFAAHAAALPPPLNREEVMAALGGLGFDESTAAGLMGDRPSDGGRV